MNANLNKVERDAGHGNHLEKSKLDTLQSEGSVGHTTVSSMNRITSTLGFTSASNPIKAIVVAIA